VCKKDKVPSKTDLGFCWTYIYLYYAAGAAAKKATTIAKSAAPSTSAATINILVLISQEASG